MTLRIPSALAALVAAAALTVGVAGAQEGAQESAAPATPPAHAHAHKKSAASKAGATSGTKSEGSYSLGLLLGIELRGSGVTADSIDYQKVVQGLKDVVSGKAKPTADDQRKVMLLVNESRSAAAPKNAAAARQFLAENAKRQGVVTTPSGLQYRVVTPGSGPSPQLRDEVTVNYRGTLLDGTEFDNSYKRGQPLTLPVGNVIKGWQEALLLMKPGAKWELFVPPELAYGPNSRPPIPPDSLLKFDVELLSVKPGSAAPPSQGPGAAVPNPGGPGR